MERKWTIQQSALLVTGGSVALFGLAYAIGGAALVAGILALSAITIIALVARTAPAKD